MEVYEDIKEKLSEFGNNVKISYAVAKNLIEKKLREKGIIADVKITEDKNGNVGYIVSSLDKSDKRNSKLGNSSGNNISKASSSNNSDKNSENKEEKINKDDKGSEDNKDNKEPNNEEKKQTPKNEDDSNVELKIGVGAGAAYGANSGTKNSNSNSKNTTNTAQENSNKNANPSNQRGQVSQSNKNNANKAKAEESNQQVSKGAASNNQQGTPVSKTSDVNKLEVSKGSSDTTQKVVSTVSNNKVGDLTFYAEENGYEVYYRTMSAEDFEIFQKTGKIPATGETFISPTQAYSEKYDGILVKFKVESGTTDELLKIGVRNNSKTLKNEFPDLKISSKGWTKDKAFFKEEPSDKNTGQINIGLGKGEALDKFNKNIKEYEVIRKQEKK